MKNIVLIGLPGSGKTTLGRLLAEKRNMKFIDLDYRIEQLEEMPIKEIFEKHGEPYFRNLETKTAENASKETNTVISAGGGIILKEENMRLLRENGIIVFINRDPAAIIKDIQTNNRPLMQNDPNRIVRLYEQRHTLYRQYSDYEIINHDKQTTLANLIRIADTATRNIKLAVIGDPVAHSLSPDIHLPVLERLCGKAQYERVRVEKNQLSDWIRRVHEEEFDGFNITMPHKVDIIPFLDEIDDDAKLYHSVNTVVRRNSKLYGHTTDGNGFLEMVHEKGYTFKDARTVIFGAGGAASTIALKIPALKAKSITILAINTRDAEMICKKIRKINSGIEINCEDMTNETIHKYCGFANILINATPIGMKDVGSDFEEFGFLAEMPKESLICDLIYHPMKTRLLFEAEQLGHHILGGIGMLIYQALLADELFIGNKINLEAMRNGAVKSLERKGQLS